MSERLIDEKPQYDKSRPCDNLSANLLCKLAHLAVAIEENTDRLGNCDWIRIRALVFDEEVQRWLSDLQRLAYIPIRKA